jgi:hypothetical protein
MKRIHLVIIVLVAASLACNQVVITAVPTAVSPATRTATVPTTITEPTATRQWTATVSQVQVNVREEPEGAVIGYLRAGDTVTILECDGLWCRIEEPSGWVFRGCLSNVAGSLKCQSKE